MHGTANSFGQELSFRFEAGGASALRRLVGCVILSALPDSDVDDALQSLREIYQYRVVENIPQAPHFVRAPATTSVITRAVVRKRERSDMVIPEP